MNEKTMNQIERMKKQTFGVEVEMNNITRKNAAKLAADFFGTDRYEDTARRNGYYTWSAWDQNGREWKFQRDVSIDGDDAHKCEIYASDLPPWFLYGYMYKRHGFMSAKDVKYLLYKPNYHFDNHLYKYDTLFISYEKPITPMTYDDNFDWFDGYDYVLDGNAMERFLDLVDQYSDCDTSSIRAEMEKKKAWYKERNGNK